MTHLRLSGHEKDMDSKRSLLQEREERFRAIYDTSYVDLLRFARRRVHPTHAEDVIGDVFLVAWRRLDDVPAELSDARAWLFGVARKIIQNNQRREDKHDSVAVHLDTARVEQLGVCHHSDLVTLQVDLATAWPKLSSKDQEVISLAVLDELNSLEAAEVLGISPTAFRLRLSRARRKLLRHLDESPSSGHPVSERNPR